MDEELIERVIAFIRGAEARVSEAEAAAARWQSEALVQTKRADDAEQLLATCQARASNLGRSLSNCQSNVRTAQERNEALRGDLRSCRQDLNECRSGQPPGEKQETLIRNQSTSAVRVEMNGRSHLVAAGGTLTVDDSGDRVTISGT